jgi:hypothetical protein
LHSEIHKPTKLISKRKNCLSSEKMDSRTYSQKGDKTDCSNYRGISLLPASYRTLSNILLSRLIPYSDEITGDHQCGLRRNRSTTDQIFHIRKILEKMLGYNGTVHQLFELKKARDSVTEALYSILTEIGIPEKLVG